MYISPFISFLFIRSCPIVLQSGGLISTRTSCYWKVFRGRPLNGYSMTTNSTTGPDWASSLQLLPLMMSFEITDVSFLSSLKAPSPSFDISLYVQLSSSHTRSSGLKLQHRFSHNNLSRHYYFIRLPPLWNRLPSSLDLLSCSIPLAKSCLANFMWSSFETHFHCSNTCSYHFHCPCSNSITHSHSSHSQS